MAGPEPRPKLEGTSEQRGSASSHVKQEPEAVWPEMPEVGFADVEREVLNRADVILETFECQEAERKSDGGLPHRSDSDTAMRSRPQPEDREGRNGVACEKPAGNRKPSEREHMSHGVLAALIVIGSFFILMFMKSKKKK